MKWYYHLFFPIEKIVKEPLKEIIAIPHRFIEAGKEIKYGGEYYLLLGFKSK